MLLQLQPADASEAERNLRDARILVFSKTEGFRHGSIDEGKALLEHLASEHEFFAEFSESSQGFNNDSLARFDVILFLNTTGDVLNLEQQGAMERFIQGGGGFVGIHAATDTERDGSWPWYIALVGGAFAGHPMFPSNVQEARLRTVQPFERSTQHFNAEFEFRDEWYDFSDLSEHTRALLEIDRDSYRGSNHSGYTKIAWQQEFDGGRSFYTNMGHREETFSEEDFIQHLLGGIEFAAGKQGEGDD